MNVTRVIVTKPGATARRLGEQATLELLEWMEGAS